ncbi:amidohydrolase family protein [Methylobacterium nodulans]|uniref:Amidohydrolase 2 n=1 Tax=Methylobacterium nodulans (strain LMG 21967 / CNCM I-2342 / ORS 2060) TaxID=460265 RepID=B8IWB1_METNO|nr:amidohydrolase family protein [Methylobacterium nodulans]ACL62701.1 amidohydrolase 2 [Methylobacterium nodulans ORS 2060]
MREILSTAEQVMTFADFHGAADCHFHIMDEAFPTVPNPAVRNRTADVAQYRAFAAEVGTTRGVVVQPSLYGTNNSHTLEALRALGAGYRAVVVIDESVPMATLRAWDRVGVRGVRFNQVQAGATTMAMMPAVAQRIADLGWHIQLHIKASALAEHEAMLRALPVPLVLDHVGRVEHADMARPGFDTILRLLAGGRTWVKLSAPYQDSRRGPPGYEDAVEVGRRLASENEDRLVWGSDWPHVTEPEKPEAGPLSTFLAASLKDEGRIRKALIQNPALLYGF